MKQMCKKKFQSPCVCLNELSNPRCLTVSVNCKLGRASFIDYSKATRVRKFYTAYIGLIETNFILISLTAIHLDFALIQNEKSIHICNMIYYV